MKRYSKDYIYARVDFSEFVNNMETSDYGIRYIVYRSLHADPRSGALPDLIWPYKWVCTVEQGMVFFHNRES